MPLGSPHRRLLLLVGIVSLSPTARSFGGRNGLPLHTTIDTAAPINHIGFISVPIHRKHGHDGGRWRESHIGLGRSPHVSCISRSIELRTRLENSSGNSSGQVNRRERNVKGWKESANRSGWLPSDVLAASTSLFRDLRKRLPPRTPGGSKDDHGEDPLDRVRVVRHLPLRQACVAIGIYLSIGVLAYKGVFKEPSWSILDALYFSCLCLSTIGYGDLVPSTSGGKIFAALFGVSGILLWSSAVIAIGTRLVQSETTAATAKLRTQRKNTILDFYEQHMPDLLKFKQPETNEAEENKEAAPIAQEPAWPLAAASPPKQTHGRHENPSQWKLLTRSLAKPLLITMSSGTLIGRLEGWNLCDSFYFSIMTATTIGFGNFSPSTRAGRTVAVALIPVMLAATANVLARVTLFITRNRTRRLFERPAERAEWLTEAQAIEMDLDGNGRVSKSEYVLYMLFETGIIDREECVVLEEQFERFDVTKSGYIESGDLKAMKKFRENLQRKSRRGE